MRLMLLDALTWPALAVRRLTRRESLSYSDEDLASRAAAGSREDFELLVKRYSASIYRVVFRMCGSAQDAEDITQETFIKALQALPRIDLDRPIKPWLYKIAVNTAVSHLRRKSGKQQVEWSEAEVPPVPDGSETVPDRLDVQSALARLPIDDRRIIVLRTVEDLSFAEIGAILEIPEATARTRYRRARQLFEKFF